MFTQRDERTLQKGKIPVEKPLKYLIDETETF